MSDEHRPNLGLLDCTCYECQRNRVELLAAGWLNPEQVKAKNNEIAKLKQQLAYERTDKFEMLATQRDKNDAERKNLNDQLAKALDEKRRYMEQLAETQDIHQYEGSVADGITWSTKTDAYVVDGCHFVYYEDAANYLIRLLRNQLAAYKETAERGSLPPGDEGLR